MKITSIRAVPVHIPRNKVLYAARGAVLSYSEFGIVFIETDEGIHGLGEISRDLGRRGVSLSHDVNTLIAPALVGKNPLNIQELAALMNRTLNGSEEAKCGVEMALFDIVGKYYDVPVYQLLGGKMRDSVPVTMGVGFGPPDEVAEEALRFAEKGFKHIKLKVGRPGTDEDVATVRAVRQKVGDAVRIRIDANTAYSTPNEAVKAIRAMERYDLELVEQPIPAKMIEGMAFIRQKIDTPLMADESMYHWADAIQLVKSNAVDVLNIYICECGGLLSAQKAFGIGEAAGMPALIGGMCETGIATAAQIHLAVAMPNLAYSSDLNGPTRYPFTLVNEPYHYENGSIKPPEGPGLGVTLDKERFEQCRIDR